MQQSVHALWQGVKCLIALSAVCYIFLLFCVLFFHLTGAFYQSILSLVLFMGIYVVLGISFEHLEHVLMRFVRKCRSKKDPSFSMPSYFTFCLFGVLSTYQMNWLTAFY